jgi:hypothetical protein
LRRSVRGKYQIGGPTLCASAPSHRYHAMPPRRTRNSDRPRASDRTMVATKSNRLPSFKNRRTLSPRENETKGTEEQARAKPLERSRGISANSGLDIETKNFSATGRRRSFFVDIPSYRTTYLKMRRSTDYGGKKLPRVRQELKREQLSRRTVLSGEKGSRQPLRIR